MKHQQLFSGFLFVLLFTSTVWAQVTISPTALYIDGQSRFGTFMVLNGSNTPQEISIEFIFGYPGTDAQGNTFMVYDDSVASKTYSMADWVRGFPRTFTLAPGQRQTVRLTVRPPADIPDGVYWTRIKTISNPLTPPIEQQQSEGVTTNISFQFQQITTGFFKKGTLSTGLEVERIRPDISDGQLVVLYDYKRTGNAPFQGTITLQLYNEENQLVKETFLLTTIYFDGVRNMALEVSDLPPGTYRGELKFVSQRADIPSTDIIQMEPVTKLFNVQIK